MVSAEKRELRAQRREEDHRFIQNMGLKPGRSQRRADNFRSRERDKSTYKLRDFVSVRPGDTIETALEKMQREEIGILPVFDADKNNVGTLRLDAIEQAHKDGTIDTSEFPVSRVVEPPLRVSAWDYNIEKLPAGEYMVVMRTDGTFNKMVTCEDASNKKASEREFDDFVHIDSPVEEAIRIMEREKIPVLPVLKDKKVVGSLSLDRAKRVMESASELFDPETSRCWALMEKPLKVVRSIDKYETVATEVGINGGVIVKKGDNIKGMVVGRLDRSRAEGRYKSRLTFLSRKVKVKGRKEVETKRGEGRPGLPGLPTKIQHMEVPKPQSDLDLLDEHGNQLGKLTMVDVDDDGEQTLAPMPKSNQIIVGLVLKESRRTSLLDEPERNNAEILRTVRECLRRCSTPALEDFDRNKAVALEPGKTIEERLPQHRSYEYPDHDEEFMKEWGDKLGTLKYPVLEQNRGDTRLETPPRENLLIIGLILEERGRLNLLEHTDLKDSRAEIFTTVRDYLSECNPLALKDFEENKQVVLREGKDVAERLKASAEPRHGEYEEYDTPPRYRPINEVKRGKPPGGTTTARTAIVNTLMVRWSDRAGNKFVENLTSENRQLAVAILRDEKKTHLLEADPDDKEACQEILAIARKYIRKHNKGMLRRFDTNIAIYLGNGDSLEERLINAKSADSRRLKGKASKKKEAMEKAADAATDARVKQREAEELLREKRRKDRFDVRELIGAHDYAVHKGQSGLLPLPRGTIIEQDDLPDVVKAIKAGTRQDIEDSSIYDVLIDNNYHFFRPDKRH